MKTKLIPTLALISAFFITTPSYAGDNRVENQSVKTTTSIISPRDAASGLPTGKRQHKSVSAAGAMDNPMFTKNSNGLSTNAHGLPTGKRQHKPVRELDKSSPQLSKAAYKKCPDGSMINPGEKCPVKAVRAGYKLCPDGSMINPGEKCPEKSTRQFQQR